MAKEKNNVSIKFWIFALIFSRIPCFGFIFAICFAFLGENETRKNFFKASLLLDLLVFTLVGIIAALGFAIPLWEIIQRAVDQAPKFIKGP